MQDQSSANYIWFRQSLSDLLLVHRNEHALLHNANVAGYYQTSIDAIRAGLNQFGEGNFSVELIDDSIEDLGFYSHVSAALHA
jgi:hypothetical protein